LIDQGITVTNEQNPWDVPATAEGRDTVRERIKEFQAQGNRREVGRGLTALSQLVMEVGSWDGRPTLPLAAALANEAVVVLRETGDRKSLAQAVRASAVPFVTPGISPQKLAEAVRGSETGDPQSEAWALYRMSKRAGTVDPRAARALREQANTLFEQTGDTIGQAWCLMADASDLHHRDSRRSAEMFSRASDLFLESGDKSNAARALTMGEVFGRQVLSYEERRQILEDALTIYGEANDHASQAHVYRCLSWLAEEFGKGQEAQAFREKEDALEIAVYGSRERRIEADINRLKRELEFASEAKERRHLQDQIEDLKASL
jgi:hypothetical protein